MQYKASLIGYHNPSEHRGLTPGQFLDLYLSSLRKKFKKRNGYQYKRLHGWIEQHRTDQLKFVARLLPDTLKSGEGWQTGWAAAVSPKGFATKDGLAQSLSRCGYEQDVDKCERVSKETRSMASKSHSTELLQRHRR